MNNLANALDAVYDSFEGVQPHGLVIRIRRCLTTLLHTHEFTSSQQNPNHPYTRFAKESDEEGNRLRLFQAMQEMVDEENSDLQPCVDLMFEHPEAPQYVAVTSLLQKYKIYADSSANNYSDDSDNSDSS